MRRRRKELKVKDEIHNCPVHGSVRGENCPQCVAHRYNNLVKLGVEVRGDLPNGVGRQKNDPSPMSIRFRAFVARRKRLEEKERRNEGKLKDERIARMYSDPVETNGRLERRVP
jgi:hypothetical protein